MADEDIQPAGYGDESPLLHPIGQSRMIGDEKPLFDEGIYKAGVSGFTSNNRKSIRYLHHDDNGNPIGALQIMTDGPRSKKAVIQNVYVAEPFRRTKIASGLLKRARQDYDVRHSDDLTDAGRAFKRSVKAEGGSVETTSDYIPHDDERRAKNLEAFAPIKDESGKPRVFYHNTDRDFTKFNTARSEMGSHFGTPNQAANLEANQNNPLRGRRTVAVHLNIKNPIRLIDEGDFSPTRVAEQLYNKGIIDDDLYDRQMDSDYEHDEDAVKDLHSAIREAGHDGIVYLNRREGLQQHPDPETNKKNLQWLFSMAHRASDEDFLSRFPDAQNSYIAISPNQIKSAIGNRGTYDPNDPDITKAEGGGITAYHGSPHDFDQFDISKIGTGEGAQAFGHGLYFAGAEPVAQTYRGDPEERYRRFSGHMDPKEEYAFDLASHSGDVRDFDVMMGLAKKYGENIDFEEAEKLARNAVSKRGHMYEVHIAAHPDHFLDWDKPLAEQAHVINAIDQHIGDPETVLERLIGHQNGTGQDLYNALGGKHKAEAVSQKLNEMGIKGIKYFDAGSRGAGQGSSNYVVFNDKLVNVKRKYARGGVVTE